MTPHQTLAVAVRLFAIWLALYVARDLIGFYVYGQQKGDTAVGSVAFTLEILTIVVVVLLWFFPRTIARRLLSSTGDTETEHAAPHTWFGVGAALIGLWLIASALPGLLYNLLTMYLFRSEIAGQSVLLPQIGYLLQILVGGALIFGMNALGRFFRWARYAGP